MTIASTASEIEYSGDGSSTVFAIPFPFDTSADLRVYLTDTDGNPAVLSSGFSVSGGGGSTGSLTMTTAPASGETLTILDDPERTQPVDYVANDAFPAETHERALDRNTRLSKRLYQLFKQCLRVSDGDPERDSGMVAPSVSSRKGKFLRFNSTTGALEVADVSTTVGAISQSIIAALLWPQSTEETAAGVTPTNLYRYYGDPRRFGASTGASASANRVAIQAALDSSGWVTIYEAYTISAAVNLRSDQIVQFVGTGSISLAGGVTTEYMLRGDTLDNVRIIGGEITGNGSAGVSSVYLTSCSNVLISDVSITKAGSIAVFLQSCSRVTVRSCDLSQNYFYGIEDRDGTGNSFFGNRCYLNGNTGVATSTGGRGINMWRCVGNYVAGNRFASNTEYGFRIYSEAADATTSYGNRIVDNHFEDNTSADLVLYDESLAGTLVKQNVIANNVAQRSTNPGLGVSFLLHGGDNTIHNCHVFKSGTFGNFVAFNFYYAVRNKVTDCSATNTADALGFSNATDCDVDGFRGRTVATVAGVAGFVGAGNVLRNSRFLHGGGGGSDVGIVHYNATGRNTIDNVELDGFATGIYIGTEAVTIRDCKTLNSTTAGFRKDGDAQTGQELADNIFDSANPTLARFLERRTAGKAVLYDTAAPTIRTWAVGDRCFNSAPSAGNPKSWVCTTAGTPGTWTSEGNL